MYDALERRPAVQVAKTISERAKEYADKYSFANTPQRTDMQGGYIKGATDQRKIDIDKACEWIHERRDWYVETEDNGISGKLSDDFFAEFRKVMEEE